MFIASRPGLNLRRPETITIDLSHPAVPYLTSLWIFGPYFRAPFLGGGGASPYIQEISGVADGRATTGSVGTGNVFASDGAASVYAGVTQSGAQATNNAQAQTALALSGNLSFSCYVMRSADTDTIGTNVGCVQEVAATEGNKPSPVGWEFNLGNGFGAAGDKNKPRISTSTATTCNGWLNGVKQSSANPFDTALTNGVFYGISGTVASAPVGDGNLCFFCNSNTGGTQFFGMAGGLALFALYSGILPDDIMADLSLNPFGLLSYPDDLLENFAIFVPSPFILMPQIVT